jgi:PPM family protein phosphatase
MENAVPEPGPAGHQDSGTALFALEVAALTDTGPTRDHNEDCCGFRLDGPATALLVVADGVSSYAAGATASQMAVDVTLRAYAEQDRAVKSETRLARAVQQANIEIHDLALAVPELRGMATTLTAVMVMGGKLVAAHVGDSRLYLLRQGRLLQLSKDHTAGQSILTRCVGRELIAAIDRISRPLEQDDTLLLCTDGVYNVLTNNEMAALTTGFEPAAACRALIDGATARKTGDNITAGIIRMVGSTPDSPAKPGVGARLRRLIGRSG